MSELTESQIDRINVILNEVPAPKPVEPKPVEPKPVAPKPVAPKKIIDLTKMIGSDIDMEFGKNTLVIGNLAVMEECSEHVNYYMNHKQKGWYHHCRVRQKHIHYYDGKGNPLPDGLFVKLYFNDNSDLIVKSQDICWDSLYGVKGFEVIETLPEYQYQYEWETEE